MNTMKHKGYAEDLSNTKTKETTASNRFKELANQILESDDSKEEEKFNQCEQPKIGS